jgi:hypothetical protein
MKAHPLSASVDLAVRANLKPLQTPFDLRGHQPRTMYRHGAQAYGSVFSNSRCLILSPPTVHFESLKLDHFPSGSMALSGDTLNTVR